MWMGSLTLALLTPPTDLPFTSPQKLNGVKMEIRLWMETLSAILCSLMLLDRMHAFGRINFSTDPILPDKLFDLSDLEIKNFDQFFDLKYLDFFYQSSHQSLINNRIFTDPI